MPLNRPLLTTILVPCIWGTTYIIFTQTLPVEHPLLVGALRALPAGLLLMALGPGLPPRDKLLPLAVLGLANIGIFFALLFVSAARLPGEVMLISREKPEHSPTQRVQQASAVSPATE